jgi:threonine/homoserine/homoserine lactone efflux protein
VVNVTFATSIIATIVINFIITITIIIIRSSSRRGPQRSRIKSPVIAAFALFFAVHIVHSRR